MLIMMDGLTAQNMPSLIQMSRSCKSWLGVIGGIASEVGVLFLGAVQSIITNILGMSMVWEDGCREC